MSLVGYRSLNLSAVSLFGFYPFEFILLTILYVKSFGAVDNVRVPVEYIVTSLLHHWKSYCSLTQLSLYLLSTNIGSLFMVKLFKYVVLRSYRSLC